MTPEDRISSELRRFVDRSEAESIDRVGKYLLARRPEPSPRFHADLQARLTALVNSGALGPRRLGLSVTAYVVTGILLIGLAAIAALGGGGPLAP